MASLQLGLLPRELVNLVASSSSRHTLHAAHLSRPALSLDGLPSLRFSSDYRRINLDEATAREFDRPRTGYSYPSIAGNAGADRQQEAVSFTEDEDAAYSAYRLDSTVTEQVGQADATTKQQNIVHGNRPAPPASTSLSPHSIPLAYTNAVSCLRRDDLDSALSWYSRLAASESGMQRSAEATVLAKQIGNRIIDTRPHDIKLLMSFAVLVAPSSFARDRPKTFSRLLAHIARYSVYPQFLPFWRKFVAAAGQGDATYRARDSHLRSAPSVIEFESRLDNWANQMIRAISLSGRHSDAVDFLKHVQRTRIRTLRDGAHIQPVAAFTYTLVLQELERRGAPQDLVDQVLALRQEAYHDVPEDGQDTSADTSPTSTRPGEAAPHDLKVRLQYRHFLREISHGVQPPPEHVSKFIEIASSQGHTEVFAARLKSQLQNSKPKAVYTRFSGMLFRGEIPSKAELAHFSTICKRFDCTYLFKAIKRKMAMSTAERLHRRLMAEMSKGQLPASQTLVEYFETCITSQRLDLVKNMGIWVSHQHTRFQTLWWTARIHRLVLQKTSRTAQQALRLFGQHFGLIGVPAPLAGYIRTITAVRSPALPLQTAHTDALADQAVQISQVSSRTGVRHWPSTHTVALALQAWFILDNSPETVLETYRSLMQLSTSANPSFSLPPNARPDAHTYSTFLTPLARQRRMDEVMRMLQDMVRRGVMPNGMNWNIALGGYARHGNERMVFDVLGRMEVTMNSKSSSSESKPGATFFSQEHARRGLFPANPLDAFTFSEPSVGTYTTAIHGLCAAKKLPAAKQVARRLFNARTSSGELVYRPGENAKTEGALKQVLSMDRLDKLGQKHSQKRLARSNHPSSASSALSSVSSVEELLPRGQSAVA